MKRLGLYSSSPLLRWIKPSSQPEVSQCLLGKKTKKKALITFPALEILHKQNWFIFRHIACISAESTQSKHSRGNNIAAMLDLFDICATKISTCNAIWWMRVENMWDSLEVFRRYADRTESLLTNIVPLAMWKMNIYNENKVGKYVHNKGVLMDNSKHLWFKGGKNYWQ